MRTGNPTMNQHVWDRAVQSPSWASLGEQSRVSSAMTMQGTAVKSGILLAVCVLTAVVSYQQVAASPGLMTPLWLGGIVGGLVLGLIMSFSPRTAPFLAVPYAVVQGAFVGAISHFFASLVGAKLAKQGVVESPAAASAIIFQAAILTFGIFAAMLIAYASRLIRPGPLFKRIMVVAIMGVMVAYLVNLVVALFTGSGFGFIHGYGPIAIAFSLFVVGLASFTLLLDFDMIEANVNRGAPKFMEWYGSFALLATLVWLYIEILRLLAKINRRD